jgi:ATP-dependent Clp protease adaptor protein ClpS
MRMGEGFPWHAFAAREVKLSSSSAILAAGGGSGLVMPEEITDIGSGGGEGSKVFLFNCECHSFEEVITQLLKAVPGMTRPLAEDLAWRVHTQGLAEVYRGGASECERVAKILGETGLIVQVL